MDPTLKKAATAALPTGNLTNSEAQNDLRKDGAASLAKPASDLFDQAKSPATIGSKPLAEIYVRNPSLLLGPAFAELGGLRSTSTIYKDLKRNDLVPEAEIKNGQEIVVRSHEDNRSLVTWRQRTEKIQDGWLYVDKSGWLPNDQIVMARDKPTK